MTTGSLGLPEPMPAMPAHETPSHRLAEHSADYLSDTELLSLVLKGTMGTERSVAVARQLLAAYGSLRRIANVSLGELRNIPGLGHSGACAVTSALALAGRLHRPEQCARVSLTTPGDVVEYMYGSLVSRRQEEFYSLLLDTKRHLICSRMITRGLLNRSHIHAREVFSHAIGESCANIILVHNHPSGDPTPSAEDIESTRMLVEAGKIIGIEILDHVIIGRQTASRAKPYVSFREESIVIRRSSGG